MTRGTRTSAPSRFARCLVVVAALAAATLLPLACSSRYGDAEAPAADAAPDVTTADVDRTPPLEAGPPDADSAPPDAGTRCGREGMRACADRYVFVTRTTTPGNFGPAGSAIAYGDALCKSEADALPTSDLRGRRWRAWLCTSTIDATTRTATVEARWIRPDGVVVFPTSASIRQAGSIAPIGDPSMGGGMVWTGCAPGGERRTTASCSDWGKANAGDEGGYGSASETGPKWSALGVMACAGSASLYCFEEDP